MLPVTLASLSIFFSSSAYAQYSATYLPSNAPPTTEEGQTGTNQCGTGSNQTSMCQNAYINSVDDFCIWAPPQPGPKSDIGDTERIEVAWCLKSGYGTRLIPDGTIRGAHFVKTPDFIQVTGVGDLTKINVPARDAGGELDPHGADGNGNPVGGLVFSNAYGELEQMFEWTNFVSDTEFCFRACKPGSDMAPTWCQHIYDEMGCEWNMPANYDAGIFEQCAGDSGEPMGVYGQSTFHQGDGNTPAPHPVPSSSQCTTTTTIGGGVAASSSAVTSASGSNSITTTGSPASTTSTGRSVSSASGSASGSTVPTNNADNNSAFSTIATDVQSTVLNVFTALFLVGSSMILL
ncbi:hypothetical protein K435DRAFT_661366 [Dendrothele bispora CBS 962.96]|uniref:Macrofage activating glyco protein n=1 Tax=Dendrothele bispora (strain CBS 962.96) TaxID=1314807 RepID=A0A4S8M801_DENBC|nr:hypothetical protein K435DRAFT_661366 [Dendrothele bispora CBS 962.96]